MMQRAMKKKGYDRECGVYSFFFLPAAPTEAFALPRTFFCRFLSSLRERREVSLRTLWPS